MVDRPLALLVCGGRDYDDHTRVWSVLSGLHSTFGPKIEVLVHGDATGADNIAHEWVYDLPGVEEITIPAPFDRVGPSAGPRRNRVLLDVLLSYSKHLDCDALVVAFPGGKGTAGMVALARKAGVDVREVQGG